MNKEIKDKWVAALKSGKYIHGKSALRSETPDGIRHCCLGVLCEVYLEETGEGTWSAYGEVNVVGLRHHAFRTGEHRDTAYLPWTVADWAGITYTGRIDCDTQDPMFDKIPHSLSILNDSKKTVDFSPVIEMIEKYF